MKKFIALLTASVLALSLVACGNKEESTSPEGSTSSSTAGKFDGTYTGEGLGHGGPITVDLTIADSKIADIVIHENAETEGLGDNAMAQMKEAMVSTNSITVDTVAGATVSSTGFLEAVKNAFDQSGATEADLVKVDGGVSLEAREAEYSADVIVVGGGGAGMVAAIEAAQNGASVIVLEKMSMVGGNTLLSGGEMAAPQNWIQVEEGIEDSADLMFEDTRKGGDNENDPDLVRVLADGALGAAEWMRDEVHVTFEDYLLFFGGHSVKRSLVPLNASGVELITKLQTKVNELNVPIHLNTRATELVEQDGKITGVTATYGDQTITYNANNAVVIASGGFGANLDMRKEYNPDMDERVLSTNSVGSTGDGAKMAEAVGAELVDMGYIQTYPTCDTENGTLLYVGDIRMEGRAILVNKEGKRFVEELERRDVISKATTEQTGGVSYLFWDEPSMVESGVNVKHKDEYENLIERGMLVKADTIEEAAAFFDIDATALQETVERYNGFAEAGKDEDFNKRGDLVPFTEGPYYIMVSKPAVHHTMGGIRINTSAQALTAEGSVIEGLYAAGEVVGDIHGTNRLGSNAIADIVVFGRIAGGNAAGGSTTEEATEAVATTEEETSTTEEAAPEENVTEEASTEESAA